MIEKPAKGVKGCLLYSPVFNNFFFRVYRRDSLGEHRLEYTDYQLRAEDIDVTIEDIHISLYEDPENPDGNKIGWSSKTLGKVKDE